MGLRAHVVAEIADAGEVLLHLHRSRIVGRAGFPHMACTALLALRPDVVGVDGGERLSVAVEAKVHPHGVSSGVESAQEVTRRFLLVDVMTGGTDHLSPGAQGKPLGQGALRLLHDGMMGNFRLGVAGTAQFDGPFLQSRENLPGDGFPRRRDRSVAFIAGNVAMGIPAAGRGR